MTLTLAWRRTGSGDHLRRVAIERRDLRADDLAVQIDVCGVCHSDLHAIHGVTPHMSDGAGPVPGHEFTEDGDVRYRFVLDMSDLDQPEASTS